MYATKKLSCQVEIQMWLVVLLLSIGIGPSQGSFWNEIPSRCIYDRTMLFSCWNSTFTHPIPLLNDLTYTMQNHHVQIRDSYFDLTLRDLLVNVGGNIENLTLINNTFSPTVEINNIFEGGLFFRLLQSLDVHDPTGIQWSQLNGSYFPQLTKVDLSNNDLTDKKPLIFDRQFYPILRHLDLSYNRLESIDNLRGSTLQTIEHLSLKQNPLRSTLNNLNQFSSLLTLDLSSTPIKQLFSITLLPRLQSFTCRQCRQIPRWQIEHFLTNCSHRLSLDFTESNVQSVKIFNPYMTCVKRLVLNDQNLVDSITSKDLLLGTNLESIEARANYALDYVHLNIYDRLMVIDLSENIYLNQVLLRIMSNFTHLQRLTLTHTALDDFAIEFYNSSQKYLHIDTIDLSYNHLETLNFLQILIFQTLDLSFNRLKIVDLGHIHFRHGMYALSLMNVLNFSSNAMELIKIEWDQESPHTIDLSQNALENVELHGQTTYTLLLNDNPSLSLLPMSFNLALPPLQLLDLSRTQIDSLESLIFLHNLSMLHTLYLNDNRLKPQHRTLNWHIFNPWQQHLKHLSLKNMSLEQLETGARLDDYLHLLTIDLFANPDLHCDCSLHPLIRWLQTPPPPLADFYEPLQKILRVDCKTPLFNLQCDDDYQSPSRFGAVNMSSFFKTILFLTIFVLILLITLKLIDRRMKRNRSRFYHRVYTDADIITLNERHITHKPDDE